MRKEVVQLYIKNNEVIFSLAWNIIFSDNWKVLVLKFLEIKNMVFLSQKVDGNMIFTDYWKVLVLIFPGMRNTVFFWSKKLMERLYLLITEKFLFWTFWWWEIRSFFQSRSWWKDDIYLVFLSFPWYSRTWEIWFFVPRQSQIILIFMYYFVGTFNDPRSSWCESVLNLFFVPSWTGSCFCVNRVNFSWILKLWFEDWPL